MKPILLISALLIQYTGCISAGYHQRKIREAKGEPPITQVKNEDQELGDFMNHVRPQEPE